VAAGPVTDEDRAAVKRLHAEGKARNVIAREIGRSGSTVSKIADALGLTFDRAETTAVATAARSADLASRRVHLAERLHDDAEKLRQQLWQPCITGAFGGKDNVWSQKQLTQPLFADQRQILSAVGIAVDRSLKLVPQRDEQGASDAVSMLDQLAAGIRAIAAQQGADEGA
jgi:hypothetical protein